VKTRVLIVPGIGNSPAKHWQSLWEASDPDAFSRITLPQREWDNPRRGRWVAAIAEAMAGIGGNVVLAAHSLGCLAVAHWAASTSITPRGALPVSPPDPDGPAFALDAQDFSAVPQERFGFRSIVVASSNDPYLTLEHARHCARAWGSRLHEAGATGHLSDGDGLGAWPIGRSLLDELRDGI